MAVTEVFMDTARVGTISNQFSNFGDNLQRISGAMEAAITILEVTAFIGLVGGTAVQMWLEQVQPIIQKAADKCLELSEDLSASVSAYENGDRVGSTRFH